jgi:resuscitation-promoting factor RpfB
MRRVVHKWKTWRRGHYWLLEHERLSPADRAWAYRTSICESGRNPRTNTGNGFYGAHQWVLSTWRAAGGSGNPIDASLLEQDVRAVRWRNIAGTSPWPNCG